MEKYTYLLDLNSADDLKQYIKDTISIITTVTYDKASRNVDITFSEQLTLEQKNTLDTLLVTFPNTEVDVAIEYKVIFANDKKITSQNWVSACRWFCTSISSVELLSYMIPNNNESIGNTECSYEVRILNLSKNTIIMPATKLYLLEEDETILNVETPLYKKSKLDLQIKKNSLCNYVIISSIGYI